MFEKIKAYVANALGIDTRNDSAGPPRKLPPRPKWQPTIAVDVERTAKTAAYHLGGKHSFAVLTNGTCIVLSPEETANPQAAAEKVMHAVLWAHPDMKVRCKNDGNWLVIYSHPHAATVVLSDVVEANWAYIEKNHLNGVVEGEVLLDAEKRANHFTESVKIGLFGRAYMFMDAVSPKVVKVWHPSEG